MKHINRRSFMKATGALVAVPALAGVPAAMAQAQAQNNSDLRVDKDIAFGKGGDIDLLLDVYHPPQGVTPKRMAIIHLFGGGFSSGSKNAGYIVNDVRALGRLGYTNVSANYRLRARACGRRRSMTRRLRFAGCAQTPPRSASTPTKSP